MGPTLNGLVKLQSIENRLGAVKAKLTRYRRNVIIQENQLRSLQNALEAKKEEIQLTKLQSDRLELDLRSRDEEIAKYRASLNLAKTNKEYSAILTQMNTSKADNSKLENQVLDLMKDIEADETECAEIKSKIEEQKTKVENTRTQSQSAATKLEADIEEIQKEWDQAAKDISAEALNIFKRVAETYDGEALSTADEDENRGSYSCGGCFMNITAETVNLLMSKDDIIRCPNCARILILSTSSE
ncbi:MAG: hypothetical protein ISS77_07315 [Phycisphaerae bacterium]|nr:hypothetical protein [Phycisphaerae bacterium]